MNLSQFFPRLFRGRVARRSSTAATPLGSEAGLFGAASGPAIPRPETRSREVQLSPAMAGLKATAGPRPGRRAPRSWFGWLWGRNRRRDRGGSLVQGELLLTQVRPVRNDFRDADPDPLMTRDRAKVLYETPPTPERRDDQDHAWNRLRNRRTASLVVPGE